MFPYVWMTRWNSYTLLNSYKSWYILRNMDRLWMHDGAELNHTHTHIVQCSEQAAVYTPTALHADRLNSGVGSVCVQSRFKNIYEFFFPSFFTFFHTYHRMRHLHDNMSNEKKRKRKNKDETNTVRVRAAKSLEVKLVVNFDTIHARWILYICISFLVLLDGCLRRIIVSGRWFAHLCVAHVPNVPTRCMYKYSAYLCEYVGIRISHLCDDVCSFFCVLSHTIRLMNKKKKILSNRHFSQNIREYATHIYRYMSVWSLWGPSRCAAFFFFLHNNTSLWTFKFYYQ